MQFEKINNKGRAQIFKSPILEKLTYVHPLIIWGIYLPILILLPWYGAKEFNFSRWMIVGVFFAGTFFWTFFEYVMHRWLFHIEAESKFGKRVIYIVHGNHHHYPRDKQRLFMPPVPSLLLATLIFGLQYLLLGKYVFLFCPGFIFGYLMYGTIHYAIHAYNPPFKWMKALWRNHHLHHYKDEHNYFGVSSTLWDHVFGTFSNSEKKEA
jgi:sterol desaturase/sphingolipid hydroxylase (fatty acid hydroxylase superfamily)